MKMKAAVPNGSQQALVRETQTLGLAGREPGGSELPEFGHPAKAAERRASRGRLIKVGNTRKQE